MLVIILTEGLIWLRSSLGKFPQEKFINGLGGTLTKFASNNPYPVVKDFLQNTAIPNSQIFGFLTLWGELLVAISLTLGSLYLLLKMGQSKMVKSLLILGLLGGMFLNLTFWLSSGWTSPSAESLNLFMFIVGFIGLVSVLKGASNR